MAAHAGHQQSWHLDGAQRPRKPFLQPFPVDSERANVVPVSIDSAKFVRSAELDNSEQIDAVAVNRRGDVLARVEGDFDIEKAAALRETLMARGQ